MEEESNNSFGALFRAAREQAGRQLSDVAAELHINTAHLQALEDEQFEKLPSHAFARGYIRAYCRALEADPEPLLKAYLRSAPRLEEWHAKQPIERELQPSRLPLVLATTAVVATVVALFVVWFLGSGYLQKEPTVVDRAEPAEVAPTPDLAPEFDARPSTGMPSVDGTVEVSVGETTDASAAVADQAREAEQKADEQASTPATDTEASDGKDDKADAVAKTKVGDDSSGKDEKNSQRNEEEEKSGSEKPASKRGQPDADNPDVVRAPQGDDRVEITLKDKSWVDIRDANGYRLLHGLYLAGASKTLIGKAPFQIFLGNAPAVELKAGGQPFDLSGFVRANKTARFAVLKQKSNE